MSEHRKHVYGILAATAATVAVVVLIFGGIIWLSPSKADTPTPEPLSPVVGKWDVETGGSIVFNPNGTMMIYEAGETEPQINMWKMSVENEVVRLMHVQPGHVAVRVNFDGPNKMILDSDKANFICHRRK